MKNTLKSLAICLSMYTIIPMPNVVWDGAGMKKVFCFFPLIGLIIGGAEYGWFYLSAVLGFSNLLYAVIAAVIPLIITGGIHMDGFIDTCDAIFSYGDPAKKLEIMKDPRTGAFGVIGCVVYLLVTTGLFSQIYNNSAALGLLAGGFFISRCLGGLAIVSLKTAKSSGLAYLFSDNAGKKTVRIMLTGFLLICSVVLFYRFAILYGVALLCFFSFLTWFRSFTSKQFGGITGDLIGFLVLSVEFIFIAVAAIGAGVAI
ncbi:MAG: adenosylcobinamide-GDP ribazoletransferase [Saccharofermentanales bacterium]